LPKNIQPVKLASFGAVTKRYSHWPHQKTLNNESVIQWFFGVANCLNCQLHTTAAAKKKDIMTKRLRTSSAFSECLMTSVSESEVFNQVTVSEVYYLKVMLLQQLLSAMSHRWRVYVSAG